MKKRTGHERRIRTKMRTVGNTIVVERNRSKVPIPANWREDLESNLMTICGMPPRHFQKDVPPGGNRSIPRPLSVLPAGSLPTGPVLFVLDLNPLHSYLQRRAIDWTLTLCDVKSWPEPEVRIHWGKNHECFVRTNLLLVDRFVGESHHSFNPHRLKGIAGIDWRHLKEYMVRDQGARHLGVRTTCGERCPCQTRLPEVWHLGWEMQD